MENTVTLMYQEPLNTLSLGIKSLLMTLVLSSGAQDPDRHIEAQSNQIKVAATKISAWKG